MSKLKLPPKLNQFYIEGPNKNFRKLMFLQELLNVVIVVYQSPGRTNEFLG